MYRLAIAKLRQGFLERCQLDGPGIGVVVLVTVVDGNVETLSV